MNRCITASDRTRSVGPAQQLTQDLRPRSRQKPQEHNPAHVGRASEVGPRLCSGEIPLEGLPVRDRHPLFGAMPRPSDPRPEQAAVLPPEAQFQLQTLGTAFPGTDPGKTWGRVTPLLPGKQRDVGQTCEGLLSPTWPRLDSERAWS